MNVNKQILIGRVGKNPDVKQLDKGKMARFSLATSEKHKTSDGQIKEDTEWHNVVIWDDKLVDVVSKYVQKGMLLYLEGKSKTRSYEKDGVTKYVTEVVLEKYRGVLNILTPKSESQKENNTGLPESDLGGKNEETEDLPF